MVDNFEEIERQEIADKKKRKGKKKKVSLKFNEPVPCGINKCQVLMSKISSNH